LGSPVISRS